MPEREILKIKNKYASSGSFKKGCIPWNKGLPIEQQPMYNKHRNIGKAPHNMGKTKDSYEPLKRVSEKLKNRIFTQDTINNMSVARKQYYKNHPEALIEHGKIMLGLYKNKPELFIKMINSMHTEEAREKAKNTIKNGYENGRIVWNKGLTKETDKRIKDMGKKISEAECKLILEGKLTPITHSFKGAFYREDLKQFFRSSWEANLVRLFNYFKIQWKYESPECRFKLHDGKDGILILDFYLPKYNSYIEVSGYFRKNKEEKLKLFRILYPNIKLHILDGIKYKAISEKYSKLINWEDPLCQKKVS